MYKEKNKMENNNKYCIIMAGGIGSRFWPLSTQEFPKQFLDILGTGNTMIQQTYQRISKIIPAENIFVITNRDYIEVCKEQLPEVLPENIVGEPMMKNTAACNLYMVNKISHKNPDANIVVLPADHLILNKNRFQQKINMALQLASENEYLITLGITPTRPDTGYGYIQYLPTEKADYYKVKTFTEKPDLEIAKSFLESGDFLWNAGIFIWNAKVILKSFSKYLPEMLHQFNSCEYNSSEENSCIDIIYPKVTKISIDNAILEKADNVYVIPADLGWSDLGTWTSVYEHTEKDGENNSVNHNTKVYNASGNIVRLGSKNKKAIIDGLKDYIVIDTDEALLICPRKNDQLIKNYVNDLYSTNKQ